MNFVRSSVPGMVWPGLPLGAGATLLALQRQLEQTQWWSPDQLLRRQLQQFSAVFGHAVATVPFYQHRFAGSDTDSKFTIERYRELPLLSRSEIQEAGTGILSTAVPPEHLPLSKTESSGSTGRPIVTTGTSVTRLMGQSLLLREHLWHRRDFSGRLAAIRTKTAGATLPGWGSPVDSAFESGPSAVLELTVDVDRQLEWLRAQDPAYVLSFASNIHLLARRSKERNVRLPGLREARSFGEALRPGIRATVREAWGVELVDSYTSEELGYIALQCPDCEHYHVQCESLLVEILRPDGSPCDPGEVGQVVVSTLQNFAMPFIRYANGDYAEAGEPCSCGRGLPVIKRILGRQRNILTLPDGRQYWPTFPTEIWGHTAPVRQLQIVQTALDRIEVRVVVQRTLNDGEKEAFIDALRECLGHPFKMDIREVDEIPRSASLKFEDFMSNIAAL